MIFCIWGCHPSSKTTEMNSEEKNALLCDPTVGACELPMNQSDTTSKKNSQSHSILYFTDPICSSCWGIEPQLRKLKIHYGNQIHLAYHMGGLLPDWSYNSGGISKPSDVYHHWREVSAYYQMPIDGRVWLDDPLASSYPPSIAFKAAEMQDPTKAVAFLRQVREMVFVQNKNIAKWEHLSEAARAVGLDPQQLQLDMASKASEAFEKDLALSRTHGIRGFPTLLFFNSQGEEKRAYGSQPYATLEQLLTSAASQTLSRSAIPSDENLFRLYPTWTAKEWSVVKEISYEKAISELTRYTASGELQAITIETGTLWTVMK
jgi:putative protein-disulfide isomerase